MDRRAKVLAVLQRVSAKKGDPDPQESLFDAGYLDSFALTDLVAGLEREFSVKIPDSDLNPRKFDSLEKIETYLEGRS